MRTMQLFLAQLVFASYALGYPAISRGVGQFRKRVYETYASDKVRGGIYY